MAPPTSLSTRLDAFRHDDSQRRRSPRLTAETSSATSSSTSNPRKRKLDSATPVRKVQRSSSGYVPPSRYAHLPELPDTLEADQLLAFVGLNPGISTSLTGHAYAHPSNRFWHLLHSSGLTPERRLPPSEYRNLPRLFNYGNTNIVSRPTKDGSALSKEEMIAGAAVLEEKFQRFRPEVICIVGKSIWEAIWKHKHGRAIKKEEFHYGWQNERENMGIVKSGEGEAWPGSRVFVATSTSGLAASMRPEEKEKIWKELGDEIARRRRERAQRIPPAL